MHEIRLHGIDAPESKHAFGTKAKEHLSDLVLGKDVVVTVRDKDRFGRTVGKVRLNDVDMNSKMVKDGFAWRYVTHNSPVALYREVKSVTASCMIQIKIHEATG